MTRQTDSLQTLLALAAQFPATLARIMERDSERITLENAGNDFEASFCVFDTSAGESGIYHGWEGEQS